ncbi:MAG: GNAT family N-acetyltransferase [Agathobacter sp.]|nr:GNAT family N-acetyltransferase [Agathobacter sp.]
MNPEIPNQTYSGVDMIVEGFEEVDAKFLEKVWQRYHHLPWEIAKTPRCMIRELSLDDLDALFELYGDEEITKYTEGLYPYEEEKEFQRAYIHNMYRFYGYGMWLVFSKETGELIGRAGLEHREYNGEPELELGYVIGTRFQRQEYAKEVCQRILGIAREITDFPRINCLIEEENKASIGLAEKLGFVWEETMDLQGKTMKRYIYSFQ